MFCPGEGLQDLAQTRYVVLFSLVVGDELASVAIAMAIAHGAGDSDRLAGIWESEFNFDFSSNFQFHSHHHAHSEIAQLSAAPISDQGFVWLVKNDAERDIELVTYGAAFGLVRRGQRDSSFRGHTTTLAVCDWAGKARKDES
jgi:hypothetical protein